LAKRSRKATGYYEQTGAKSYRLTVTVDKKRHRKTVKVEKESELQRLLIQFAKEIREADYVEPSKIKLKQFTELWIERFAKKTYAPSTFASRMNCLNTYILPEFGNRNVGSITKNELSDFLQDLMKDGTRRDGKDGGLSAGTVETIHRALQSVFKFAKERSHIQINPMESVKKPKSQMTDKEVYSTDEISKVINLLEDEDPKWKLLVLLAIFTGMRRGEIIGLEWKHIDFENCVINVQQALTYTNKTYHVRQPKTKSGIRSIGLPSQFLSELKIFHHQAKKDRIASAELWNNGDYFFVFTSPRTIENKTVLGHPFNPSSVTTWWRRFTQRNELKFIPFHNLRHTSATWLIMSGENIKTVSARLGHSKIQTTLDIYTKALQEADKVASDKFNVFYPKES